MKINIEIDDAEMSITVDSSDKFKGYMNSSMKEVGRIEFDKYIRREHEDTDVMGVMFDPVEILKELSIDDYERILFNWINSESEIIYNILKRDGYSTLGDIKFYMVQE